MSTYNYHEVVANDCYDAIKERITNGHLTTTDYTDANELAEAMNEELWTDDSVTGNGSGSYFFNTYAAEEALCHNFDILREVINEFGDTVSLLDDPEGANVSIRCYLLNEGIANAIERLEDEGMIKYQGEEEDEEEEEEDTDTTPKA